MDLPIREIDWILKPLDILCLFLVAGFEQSLFDVVQGFVDPNAVFGRVVNRVLHSICG